MKCGLVQILAVAMLLGHTVSVPRLNPNRISSIFNSAIGQHASNGAKVENSAKSNQARLNILPKVDNTKQKLITAKQNFDIAKKTLISQNNSLLL